MAPNPPVNLSLSHTNTLANTLSHTTAWPRWQRPTPGAPHNHAGSASRPRLRWERSRGSPTSLYPSPSTHKTPNPEPRTLNPERPQKAARTREGRGGGVEWGGCLETRVLRQTLLPCGERAGRAHYHLEERQQVTSPQAERPCPGRIPRGQTGRFPVTGVRLS